MSYLLNLRNNDYFSITHLAFTQSAVLYSKCTIYNVERRRGPPNRIIIDINNEIIHNNIIIDNNNEEIILQPSHALKLNLNDSLYCTLRVDEERV